MYILALVPLEKPPRALTNISLSGISFNLNGYRLFETIGEVEAFKERWKNHFFDLDTLLVMEKPKDAR